MRACDLAAIAIQDRVFLGGTHPDQHYGDRRDGALIVAVNCAQPSGTCFCASAGAGPRAAGGFDIALTELLGSLGHRFLAEAGTERGAAIVSEVGQRLAGPGDLAAARAVTDRAAASMGRALPDLDLRALLTASYVLHTIRDVGPVTRALCALTPGERVGVRGPYGTHWPLAAAEDGDLVFAAEPLGTRFRRPGSHTFSLADVVELARALGRVPVSLVGYGIEVASLTMGEPLSPEASAAVLTVTGQLLDELTAR